MSYEPSVKLCQTPRPEIVTIKLTRYEKLALRDMSEKERMSVSAIVRQAVFNRS